MPASTRSRRNGGAPAVKAPAEQVEQVEPVAPEVAPEPEPVEQVEDIGQDPGPLLDIAAQVAAEEIGKGNRVYEDVTGVPRTPTADAGTLATVQRERRADGSYGEYLLAEIRKGKSGAPDSVQRFSIARVQALKVALESAGVTTLY